MAIDRRSESKIFILTAALALALSTAATAFAALQPHPLVPRAHSTPRADHPRRMDHPSHWLIHATDWIVLITDRALG